MKRDRIDVRVLFVDRGVYHSEVISVPGAGRPDHERLIDFLVEDAAVAAECYIDSKRLCSAQIVSSGGPDSGSKEHPPQGQDTADR